MFLHWSSQKAEWMGLLNELVFQGSLAGGDSIGETTRKGYGCLFAIIVVVIVFFTPIDAEKWNSM